MDYIFDIIILAVLAFFAWRGAKKGLVLTLCGLVAVFVAFFGAQFVSGHFYGVVSNVIEPGIYQSIVGVEPEQSAAGDGQEDPDASISLPDLLDSIQEAGLFAGLSGFLDDAVEDGSVRESKTMTPAQAVADYLADVIAKAVLFLLVFLLVLLVWFLLAHALDLAFHLPILSAVNTAGGLVLGLVKAVIVVLVLVWVGQLSGKIPMEPTTPVLALFTPRRIMELLNQLIV